jgi:MFS family permease
MSEAVGDTVIKQEVEHHEMEQLNKVNSHDDPLRRNELGHDASELDNYWASPRLIGSVLATFLLANSIFIGYAMPVNILSVINADIGPSPNLYLITLVNTVFTGVLHLFFARLSDILGRRYFLLGGQTLGAIGSIICATGNSVDVLIGGSVLTGIGGAAGLLYPVIIHELLPNKYRHWGQAAITVTVLPTLGFGALIARSMIAYTGVGWRGVYWLNVAVAGGSVVLFATCYFPPTFHMINSELSRWEEVRSLDYGVS